MSSGNETPKTEIKKKPFGIKFLTVATGILSSIFLFTGIVSLAFSSSALEGILLVTLSVLGFVFTRATWQLKRWAWIIHLFIQFFNIFSALVIVITSLLGKTIIDTRVFAQIIVAFLFIVNLYEGRKYFT